ISQCCASTHCQAGQYPWTFLCRYSARCRKPASRCDQAAEHQCQPEHAGTNIVHEWRFEHIEGSPPSCGNQLAALETVASERTFVQLVIQLLGVFNLSPGGHDTYRSVADNI